MNIYVCMHNFDNYNEHCIGINIPLNATVELLEISLKLFTPEIVRLT